MKNWMMGVLNLCFSLLHGGFRRSGTACSTGCYVRPRLANTDYVDHRKRGFVIGSGMMKSTCKQLVRKRLKGCGRQRSKTGRLAMIALVCHRLNQTWVNFWASRTIDRTA